MPDQLSEAELEAALDALERLAEMAPTEELRSAAREFRDALMKTLSAGEAFQGETRMAVEKVPSQYRQPTFQCYEDYKKCRREGRDTRMKLLMCSLLLALCLGERFMPFTGGGGGSE